MDFGLIIWLWGWMFGFQFLLGVLKMPRWSLWLGWIALFYIYLTHIPTS